MRYGLRLIPTIDLALILLEVVALAALIVQKLLESELARTSALSMVFGEGMLYFWFGIIFLGVLLPAALSFLTHRSRPEPVMWAVSSTAILTSGLALRYCLILGGLHVASM
jgi:formate-dependent nitrite reductase membrane component NrfD